MTSSSTGPPNDLNNGKLEFVQHFLPPLEAGDYSLDLTQTVSSGDAQLDTYNSKYQFSVGGVRFTLAASELAAAFPPNGNQGDYSESLPHLVFVRKTLPWERSVLPGQFPPKPPSEPDFPSWLALLVFHNPELPSLDYQAGTLADLLPKAAGGTLPDDESTLSYPGLTTKGGSGLAANLERGENLTDPLYYLDIPVELFNAVAPSVDDLKVLAHARAVDVSGKSDSQLRGDGSFQNYSVLVANRLPAQSLPATATEVHLVSLEGMGEFLPQDNTYQKSTELGAQVAKIRLASLYRWKFIALTPAETFAQFLLAVDAGAIGLPAVEQGTSSEEQQVAQALEMGYVPFRHETRNGQVTISWYRGPLVPFTLNDSDSFPKEHADALLRYNPNTGMFDVSYAAAWQLGRLLGLSQKGYARDLYRYKKIHLRSAVRQMELDLMQEKWGDLIPPNASGMSAAELHREIFHRVARNHLAAFAVGPTKAQEYENK